MRIPILALVVLAGAFCAQPSTAQTQYARTARQGHTWVFMYKTSKSFCSPAMGHNAVRIVNNTAVQIEYAKMQLCGSRTAALVRVNVVEGVHAGEKGWFLKTDLKAAPDLAH